MQTDRDALAARFFPKKWALVANLSGGSKKRQQLRKEAEHRLIYEEHKSLGHSCATCACLTRVTGFSPSDIATHGEFACGLDSDFHGYAITTLDNLCYRWRENQKATA